MQGQKSQHIPGILGYAGSEEVIHRDNISMMSIRNQGESAESVPPPYAVLNDIELDQIAKAHNIPHKIPSLNEENIRTL